jgi:two-component system, NarL family, sensor histidine kinase LiaS
MSTTAVEATSDAVGRTRCPEPSRRKSRPPCSLTRAESRSAATQASIAKRAVLAERARIARELHDSVTQTLYAITLSAARARRLLEQSEDPEVQRMIEDVVQLATAGQCELRALLTNIRSDQLTSKGLRGGLAHLAADVRARHGLDIRLSLADEPHLAAPTHDALVLISREALHNVVRHASADRVDIVLNVDVDEVVLSIADNGRGFDPARFRPGHFGLESMRERAVAAAGTLEVVSAEGIGTHIRVRIPARRKTA